MSNSTLPLKPIFRWAGSKAKLVPTILTFVPLFSRYVEPFAGSACLFFAMRPKSALLADINSQLIETYATIRERPTDVGKLALSMPISESFYYELRGKHVENLTEVERAARFLYLNRFCFNGVYRTNRRGEFNVPRGTRTGSLPTIEMLVSWSRSLRQAKLIAGDFESCLQHVKSGDFVYLDPPYAKPNSRDRGEYGYTAFGEADLIRISRCLDEINRRGAVFVFSYKYSTAVKRAFAHWHTRSVVVRRHVAGFVRSRVNVREVFISNRPFTHD